MIEERKEKDEKNEFDNKIKFKKEEGKEQKKKNEKVKDGRKEIAWNEK